MTNLPAIKIVVLGSKQVGKTALVVRFLTKRYIGEYRSGRDLFYKKMVTWDDVANNVEILDASRWMDEKEIHPEQIRWADAFLVVYSICDRSTFEYALHYVSMIKASRAPSYVPVTLVGNMLDLEHGRQVALDDAHERAVRLGCHVFEVSAAESHVGITVVFQGLIREIRTLHMQRSLPRHRKLSIVTMSRMFGAVFGKNNGKVEARKRRTSFSL